MSWLKTMKTMNKKSHRAYVQPWIGLTESTVAFDVM